MGTQGSLNLAERLRLPQPSLPNPRHRTGLLGSIILIPLPAVDRISPACRSIDVE
jgi:hypothetical protein